MPLQGTYETKTYVNIEGRALVIDLSDAGLPAAGGINPHMTVLWRSAGFGDKDVAELKQFIIQWKDKNIGGRADKRNPRKLSFKLIPQPGQSDLIDGPLKKLWKDIRANFAATKGDESRDWAAIHAHVRLRN